MEAVIEELPLKNKSIWCPAWPIAVYFLLVMALAIVIEWMEQQLSWKFAGWNYAIFNGLRVGLIFGLASWLAVVGGLWGRCWLIGVWLASLLAAMLMMVYLVSENMGQALSDLLINASGLCMIPLIVLGISLPMLALRFIWGWQFVHSANIKPLLRSPLGLEEIMLGTTTVAAVLFLTRVPQSLWELPMHVFLAQLSIANAMLVTVSLMSALPIFVCFVQLRSPWKRGLLAWWGSSVLTATVYGIFGVQMNDGNWNDAVFWIELGIVGGMTGIIFSYGLMALTWSGYQVAKSVKRIDLQPEDAEEFERNTATARREHRYWVSATLAVSVLSSFTLIGVSSFRYYQDQRLAKIARQLQPSDGRIVTKDRQIVELVLGKIATDGNLEDYAQHEELRVLSLAESQVTDVGLAKLKKLFPNLAYLDLSGTKITSDGLEHLLKLPFLTSLSLAGTELEIAEINHFLRSRITQKLESKEPISSADFRLQKLDLSNIELDHVKLSQLEPAFRRLAVRNCGLTDASLSGLRGRPLEELDISGNLITGSGLAGLRVQSLIAEDVPLTDAAFGKFVTARSFDKLVLSNTHLTDAILPKLGAIHCLVLGAGQFTDAGAESMRQLQCNHLGLQGPQFTGTCLDKLPVNSGSLDLSGSGITDENLRRLQEREINFLGYLDLSNTKISDYGLHALEGQTIHQLNLSGTLITAIGLAKCRLEAECIIYLEFNQFSPDELRQLHEYKNIVVGERFPDPY